MELELALKIVIDSQPMTTEVVSAILAATPSAMLQLSSLAVQAAGILATLPAGTVLAGTAAAVLVAYIITSLNQEQNCDIPMLTLLCRIKVALP